MIALTVLLALLVDYIFGEVKAFHPLVAFGRWAHFVERKLNSHKVTIKLGVLCYFLVITPIVLPFCILGSWLEEQFLLKYVVSSVVLYLAIGWKSLKQHGMQIFEPLQKGDLAGARRSLAMIVSRDTQHLGETEIAKAATESVLENGADAIYSAIFWFCVLGIPGVVLYRLSNTLDAMWGYRNSRFENFGFFAAKVDDVLNYIPARLTAIAYAFVGRFRLSVKCWRQQGHLWKSPNAGPVMAAGAGALNVSLGGPAVYHGELQDRIVLGPASTTETSANAQSIKRACQLVDRALILWLFVVVLINAMVINWS